MLDDTLSDSWCNNKDQGTDKTRSIWVDVHLTDGGRDKLFA